ncbi:MAG: hypothetical protein OEZ21_01200 [Candidatus Bathyarchaeota archaeon]|nr:hypothetical protein [Candidatus Bathyarchaeota archaeon]MDH5745559.1 hypothetical protein [Candidatus Bathyarchaeota archaeon]
MICKYVGGREDLERLSISELLEECMTFSKFQGYPEPLDGSHKKLGFQSSLGKNRNGAVKKSAKNTARATW